MPPPNTATVGLRAAARAKPGSASAADAASAAAPASRKKRLRDNPPVEPCADTPPPQPLVARTVERASTTARMQNLPQR
jgi:hypothetical protein